MTFSTAEKIETIVESYTYRGVTTGAMGTVTDLGNRTLQVHTDDQSFTVEQTRFGWSVSLKGFEGIANSLLDAAHNCLDGAK